MAAEINITCGQSRPRRHGNTMNKNVAVEQVDTGYHGKFIIRDRKGKSIFARTPGQDRLLDAIENNDIVFVNGPSGTGKTAIATWVGINGLDNGTYRHLVLTRPVVSGGEELGFLPGTMDEKIAPYMQPLYDSISLIKGRRNEKPAEPEPQLLTAKEKKRLRAEKRTEPAESLGSFYDKVQVCPLAYIRGSTLAESFIVCDEFQNTTSTQMKTMLTRLGRGSKMIICGDREQCDLRLRDGHESGFAEAFKLLKGVHRIGFVELGIEDIVRHRLIKDIILRYERPEEIHLSQPDEESEAKRYVYGTHAPGWSHDREGYDFSDNLDDDDDDIDIVPYDSVDIDEDNARFADEWARKQRCDRRRY